MPGLAQRLLRGNYIKKGLPQRGKIIAEYIWIDGSGINLRSKAKTLPRKVTSLDELDDWGFDGSSTKQATTKDSEVILRPVSFFPDPLRGGDNIIVMCSTYRWADKENTKLRPANTNFRHFAEPILEKVKGQVPWFGLEQEYTLFENVNRFTKWPLGWPEGGFPEEQGPFYCSVGTSNCFGRAVADVHYDICLAANLDISGTNAEVMPGQWEFQIGPTVGLAASDHMWVARYLLGRVTEDLDVGLSLEPKPIKGDWNGAGCHANFSTKSMREDGGFDVIVKAIEELGKAHNDHMKLYGLDNKERLTGRSETAQFDSFSYGIGDRSVSIRIPTNVNKNKKGFLEDRRPGSNIDPYIVSALLCSTTLLGGEGRSELITHYDNWLKGVDTNAA